MITSRWSSIATWGRSNRLTASTQFFKFGPSRHLPFGPNWRRSRPPARKKPRPWSMFEDIRLLAGIHRFGLDNWGSVAQFVGTNRTRAQCAQRCVRGLDPRISKDQWSPEDEEHLLLLVREKGTRIWSQIASAMGNRSDVQCRYHFFQMHRDGKLPADLVGLIAQEKAMQDGPNEGSVLMFPSRANSLGPCPVKLPQSIPARRVPLPARSRPKPFQVPKQASYARRPVPVPLPPTVRQHRRLSLPTQTEFAPPPRQVHSPRGSYTELPCALDPFCDSGSDVPQSAEIQPTEPQSDFIDWNFRPPDNFNGGAVSGIANWW
jgi:hypothetical protein